jgi:NAD(P)-dependent dehydrogenase (short-subunit alcohol dehydrogenase family)
MQFFLSNKCSLIALLSHSRVTVRQSSSTSASASACLSLSTNLSSRLSTFQTGRQQSHSHLSSRLSSSNSNSSFEAPEPPTFNGKAIFPNIDIKINDSTNTSINTNSEAYKRNSDPNAVYVVTGASRGIGLQMVKTLSYRTKGTIIACCRTPDDALELKSFMNTLPSASASTSTSASRIEIQQLDLENQNTITTLSKIIKEKYNRVDMLLNVAGILGDGQTTPGPERSVRNLDRDWVQKTFNVNYIGPIFLCQALIPMMKSNGKMRAKQSSKTTSSTSSTSPTLSTSPRAISVIANLSARVGSISDNGLGGWMSYRSSKAALNQATKTMSMEVKRQGTWTLCLHPGTTNTDLSKPFQKNVKESRLFPVDFTVEKLLDVIDNMEECHTGGFYDWSGTALPY